MWLFIVSFISGRCFAFDAAEFPEQLGDLERGQIQQFDPRLPGAGYMVQYRGSSISATVYVYDRGLASIPEETRSPLIFRELATVMRDVHRLAKRREQEEITIIRENDPAFLGPYELELVVMRVLLIVVPSELREPVIDKERVSLDEVSNKKRIVLLNKLLSLREHCKSEKTWRRTSKYNFI
ncbi:MAG: hypothetical protein AAF525_06390 [Pseudomonadota bacterium]